jgi:Importin repeat
LAIPYQELHIYPLLLEDPSSKLASGDDTEEDGMALDKKEDMRKAALESMISLSEAKPAMVMKVDGWTAAIVRGCLDGMRELGDDTLDVWLEADVRIIVITYSLEADVDYSLRRTRRMSRTRTCTSSRSIASRALWAARLYSRLLSNTYPVCSPAMTGG